MLGARSERLVASGRAGAGHRRRGRPAARRRQGARPRRGARRRGAPAGVGANERRARQGLEPLDVDAEVARTLARARSVNTPSTGGESGINARMADPRSFELDELTHPSGHLLQPPDRGLLIVDDSPEVDHEIFDDDEPGEGADWVLISDEAPLDEHRRDELIESFQVDLPPRAASWSSPAKSTTRTTTRTRSSNRTRRPTSSSSRRSWATRRNYARAARVFRALQWALQSRAGSCVGCAPCASPICGRSPCGARRGVGVALGAPLPPLAGSVARARSPSALGPVACTRCAPTPRPATARPSPRRSRACSAAARSRRRSTSRTTRPTSPRRAR